MKNSLAFLPFLLVACHTSPPRAPIVRGPAPESTTLALGGELRAYPAGVVPAFVAELELPANGVLTASLGLNVTDRGDFGEHDDEEGEGPGFGIGYRRYLDLAGILPGDLPAAERLGWFAGGRVDLWFLDIDWEDDPNRSGSTDVIVVQPTGEGGYSWRAGGGWRMSAFLALGAEINVDEDGEDVGDGLIGLIGISGSLVP